MNMRAFHLSHILIDPPCRAQRVRLSIIPIRGVAELK